MANGRVVCHIDLDCFYVQVERQKDPTLHNVPCAVVQYNKWQGGAIIALSYEAKAKGVKRNMRGGDAAKVCPGIRLVTVPVGNEKADLTCYREAGTAVFELLSGQGAVTERTSIDEAYIDVTALAAAELAGAPLLDVRGHDADKSHVLGLDVATGHAWTAHHRGLSTGLAGAGEDVGEDVGDVSGDDEASRLLVAGAVVAAQLRAVVKDKLGYSMSAGIAHNKMLAKHASGMHKPFQQTVVPSEAVADLMASIPVNELNGFGGKRGEKLVADYKISRVGDLLAFPLNKLQRDFGDKAGKFMWEAARGICEAKVVQKLVMDSISNGKTFTGNVVPGGRLQTMAQVEHFCGNLCVEVFARMALLKEKHSRVPTLCTVSIHHGTETVVRKGVWVKITGGSGGAHSRSFKLHPDMYKTVDALKAVVLATAKTYLATRSEIHITGIYVNVSKMAEVTKDSAKIGNWFKSTDALAPALAPATTAAGNGDVDGSGGTASGPAVAADDDGAWPRTAPAPELQHVELNPDAVDAEFLAQMPEDIRNELLAELGRQCAVDADAVTAAAISPDVPPSSVATAEPPPLPAASSMWIAATGVAAAPVEKTRNAAFEGYARDSIDPAVLASLPPSIRREINQQINRPAAGAVDAASGSSGGGHVPQKKRGSTGKASSRGSKAPAKKQRRGSGGAGAGITKFFKQPPPN